MNWTDEQYSEYLTRIKQGEGVNVPIPVAGPLESVIEAECSKLLEEDGWRALRTDPVSDRSRGKGFGELGMADHLYIRYIGHEANASRFRSAASIMWVEFKRPGEKPQKHQTSWHIKERARGALTLIAGEDFPATVEGFREWYSNSGLMRNRNI